MEMEIMERREKDNDNERRRQIRGLLY